jgi:hypothetical protein
MERQLYGPTARNQYEGYWNEATAAQHKFEDAADKWLLTLASGSFGVSFAFIDHIIPTPLAHSSSPGFIIAAWSLFGLCLIIELISFFVSSRSFRMDADHIVDDIALIDANKPVDTKVSGKHDLMFWINLASLISFIGGILCLVLFIARNLL